MPKYPTLKGSPCLTLSHIILSPFQSSSPNTPLLKEYKADPWWLIVRMLNYDQVFIDLQVFITDFNKKMFCMLYFIDVN